MSTLVWSVGIYFFQFWKSFLPRYYFEIINFIFIWLTHSRTAQSYVWVNVFSQLTIKLNHCKLTQILRECLPTQFCQILGSSGIVWRIYVVPIIAPPMEFLQNALFINYTQLVKAKDFCKWVRLQLNQRQKKPIPYGYLYVHFCIGNCSGTRVLEKFSTPLQPLTVLPIHCPCPFSCVGLAVSVATFSNRSA